MSLYRVERACKSCVTPRMQPRCRCFPSFPPFPSLPSTRLGVHLIWVHDDWKRCHHLTIQYPSRTSGRISRVTLSIHGIVDRLVTMAKGSNSSGRRALWWTLHDGDENLWKSVVFLVMVLFIAWCPLAKPLRSMKPIDPGECQTLVSNRSRPLCAYS